MHIRLQLRWQRRDDHFGAPGRSKSEQYTLESVVVFIAELPVFDTGGRNSPSPLADQEIGRLVIFSFIYAQRYLFHLSFLLCSFHMLYLSLKDSLPLRLDFSPTIIETAVTGQVSSRKTT